MHLSHLRIFLVLGAFQLVGHGFAAEAPQPSPSGTNGSSRQPVMVIVHGAWGGAWQFAKVEPLLREQGIDVRRVTLTGLGEREHLASPEIGLETHIKDVVNVILYENLHDVILVGHSYGGMVITGVADRIPHRIARLVYLDAFLPKDGDCVLSLLKPGSTPPLATMLKDGFIPPWWLKGDKLPPHDVPQPYKTFTDRISLKNPAAWYVPGTYILTVDRGKKPEDDDFYEQSLRAKERHWPVIEMEADHNPEWRKPAETAELLGSLR